MQPTPVPRMGTANLSNQVSVATPTMQQRMKNIGIATPLAVQSPVRRYDKSILTLILLSVDDVFLFLKLH
jgi:hypothetical protein